MMPDAVAAPSELPGLRKGVHLAGMDSGAAGSIETAPVLRQRLEESAASRVNAAACPQWIGGLGQPATERRVKSGQSHR